MAITSPIETPNNYNYIKVFENNTNTNNTDPSTGIQIIGGTNANVVQQPSYSRSTNMEHSENFNKTHYIKISLSGEVHEKCISYSFINNENTSMQNYTSFVLPPSYDNRLIYNKNRFINELYDISLANKPKYIFSNSYDILYSLCFKLENNYVYNDDINGCICILDRPKINNIKKT